MHGSETTYFYAFGEAVTKLLPIIVEIDGGQPGVTVLAKRICKCGHDSSVGVETTLWIGSPTGAGNFSFPQNAQTKCGAYPASYLAFTGVSIPGGKAAVA